MKVKNTKNISLLIDANVIVDYLLVRQPQFSDSTRVLSVCQNNVVKGYVAFHSLPSIWYTLRKNNVPDRRVALTEIIDFLEVTGAPHSEVVSAIKNENFPDFEDCLQEKCAVTAGADYIVTGNIKDFKTSSILAVTPAEMLEILLNMRLNNES